MGHVALMRASVYDFLAVFAFSDISNALRPSDQPLHMRPQEEAVWQRETAIDIYKCLISTLFASVTSNYINNQRKIAAYELINIRRIAHGWLYRNRNNTAK